MLSAAASEFLRHELEDQRTRSREIFPRHVGALLPPRGSAELYYELHGATRDSTYQTDIEVKGVYGDAKGTVHLTFKEKAHGSLVRTRRSIGLDKLEEGQYQVTVTVTEQGTGKTAVQSRYLNVRR